MYYFSVFSFQNNFNHVKEVNSNESITDKAVTCITKIYHVKQYIKTKSSKSLSSKPQRICLDETVLNVIIPLPTRCTITIKILRKPMLSSTNEEENNK